ncbi:LuxR family transcriptional regulator [Amycolatopsis suaedae]|uniref:Helix-turn-helix transcriptional regulator n=1 Tax=Amycolatopsis suaedae TaxID=2510978 RepID=A0A4V2EL30_9PSEU|nr:LuxR family transcriptional regulator [Amycolatopsis suaedae]RZQ60135.1 helix-turn-helix transcriptional regulator [Amycolatopsis suaedae]
MPFVARDAEIAALLAAADSPGAFVVVEGEPESGKTRLLDELCARTAARSARCAAHDGSVPLGPVVDAVERTGPPSKPPPVTGALRTVLPEWAPRLPEAPATTSRHHLFRALREVLGDGPLVLDDIHLADEETHAFLRFLTGSRDAPAVVVSSAPGARWPARADATLALTLGPFPVDAVAALAGSTTPAGELHRRAAGRVGEILAQLQDGGTERFRARTAARLAAQDSAVREVVEASAVLAEAAGAAVLGAVSGLPADTAIARAVTAGLLADLGMDRYAPGSPLTGEAVYATLPGPRRARLHARAAAALATSVDPPSARIAWHHRRAGEIPEWIRWTSGAVDQASPDEAVRLLEEALDDPGLPRTARETFAVRLSREMPHGLVRDGTISRLRQTVRDHPLSGSARGEIRMHLGRVLINQTGQVDAGRHEIELASADLAGHEAVLARGLASLSLPHLGAVPVQENLRWLALAERASRTAGDAVVTAAVTANRMSARMQVADPDVWQDIETLPAAPDSADVRRQVSRAYVNLADAAAWNGHYAAARGYLATAKQLTTDERQPYLDALAAGTSLRLDVATGVWATVDSDAARLLDQVGAAGPLAAEPLVALGWHDNSRGRRTAALRHFERAHALAEGSAPLRASTFAGRVTVHLAGKDLVAASALARQGLAGIRTKDNWVWAAELLPLAVRVLVLLGGSGEAAELLAEFQEGIAGRDAPLATAADLLCQGMLARDAGEPARAAELFGGARVAYDALPRPYSAASAGELAGDCQAELGDAEAAVAAYSTAEALYHGLGSAADALRCRRAMRRCDPLLPRRGRRGYGPTLSPRETEVARLAARGLTNRQIAELLFLSPRTVEIHVGKALRKLGLPSRSLLTEETLRKINKGP